MAVLDKHIPLLCALSGAWTSSRHSKAPWLGLRSLGEKNAALDT